jgi:curved DNA-binding protein CbpA
MKMPTYYEILNIEPYATPAEIEQQVQAVGHPS